MATRKSKWEWIVKRNEYKRYRLLLLLFFSLHFVFCFIVSSFWIARPKFFSVEEEEEEKTNQEEESFCVCSKNTTYDSPVEKEHDKGHLLGRLATSGPIIIFVTKTAVGSRCGPSANVSGGACERNGTGPDSTTTTTVLSPLCIIRHKHLNKKLVKRISFYPYDSEVS